MEKILEKVSSYNIFNYLFPGAAFCVAGVRTGVVEPIKSDLITTVLVYYFVGLVISRIGSIILEPILKTARIIKFGDYPAFVEASKNDPKMETLVEVANTYRTIAAGCIVLLLAGLLSDKITLVRQFASDATLALTFMAAIFVWSYRKQNGFIDKRVAKRKGV